MRNEENRLRRCDRKFIPLLVSMRVNVQPEQFNVCAGKLLYTGKVIDVRRYIGDGYTRGTVIIAPFSNSERDSTAATTQSSVPSD
jgi:hypothetical protein